jgi:2-succinyl-6-hydroxy-2,4-cyclohexadiene-1-carboxylate synthase
MTTVLVDPLPRHGVPLLAIHGFAGQPSAWDEVVAPLDVPLVRVRLPGHGFAPTGNEVSFDGVVDALAAALAPVPRWDVAGYSLGARVALGLVVRHPTRFRRALLVGVNPGLETDADRAARRVWDEQWADRIERDGIAAFERAWSSLPLFDSQLPLPSAKLQTQREARLAHDAAGLAWAMRQLGLANMPSRWPALDRLTLDVTVVCGALDTKYRAIAERMAAQSPKIEVAVVADAGHNPLLEQPEALGRVLAETLQPSGMRASGALGSSK